MAERAKSTSLAALGLTALKGRDAVITGLSVDSRDVKDGHLFAALPGSNVHGGEFIKYALRQGAGAILTDRAGLEIARKEIDAADVAVVLAQDPRQALAYAAALWFGAQPETMIAVTGTNGKTSVATFTRQIWTGLGLAAVNLGTTGIEGAFEAPLGHTTPEPITLHRALAQIAQAGVTHAAMEASSHGLAQRRLDGVSLAAAAFTNFSQDHLDYHASFDDYFNAKMGLFRRVLSEDGAAVVNIDDPRGAEVADLVLARGQDLISVGRSQGAHLRISGQRYDATGQDLRFDWNG
ncbi:MAG: UDP-N-acetylmuramoyl-L-alanyl-D-glutamate--2,6-diaminopimelate ligase, partial [Marinosulfonomonas sp.]|nr:UDP-N-acetylmuramoyl-L-alanyl-D-glutamate--2,6-diaminopimelate ligase [Marinosulfonomonas sp.]